MKIQEMRGFHGPAVYCNCGELLIAGNYREALLEVLLLHIDNAIKNGWRIDYEGRLYCYECTGL